ncbi:MAG TPA: hypothetical protein VHG10_06685 [Glycomyces sp.]|nr:hypothetical protein [Glycomyces sp.]
MSYPPPPPDRMHLQYQPAPPPPPGPQQMGPGGAYGPMQPSLEQPLPGQMPATGLSMSKPGTITGIQVILWIFLLLGVVGDVMSAISMVNFFNPFSLIGLAFAVYSTVQALLSGVHINRGKRWAWIWSLISAILGLALSLTGFVFGAIMFDQSGDIMLTVAAALVVLYGTLLGLLCSKSARQWILMHRVQRGEVQMPGTAMGGMAGGAPGARPGAPERPATKPGSVTFTVVLTALLLALTGWLVIDSIRVLIMLGNSGPGLDFQYMSPMYGSFRLMLSAIVGFAVLVGALCTAIGLHRGKFGARVFTIVWTSVLLPAWGFLALNQLLTYLDYHDLVPPPQRTAWNIALAHEVAVLVLVLAIFIAVLTPGVRAWTPGKPSGALIVMVPMGQQQAPQQPGPYGRPQGPPMQQQGPYGQQQPGPYGPPQQPGHYPQGPPPQQY